MRVHRSRSPFVGRVERAPPYKGGDKSYSDAPYYIFQLASVLNLKLKTIPPVFAAK
jgi:hypothetical protein